MWLAGRASAHHNSIMSLALSDSSNRGRVSAALAGVALVLAFVFFAYALNQTNKPQVVHVGKISLRSPVAVAVRARTEAWRITGQYDPDIVRGLSGRMKRGMSAWYPDNHQARIATPGGCVVWLQDGQLRSASKQCLGS